ncbi:unnamed protein product [Rotaria sp. Silwood2]|nr:unnamed protein product [Rotaria sp. Silwood2]
MADVDGPIPFQSTCDPSTHNDTCSSSIFCQCATVPTGERICTQQMSCVYATPCDLNDVCAKPNSTCVIDSRCPGTRLCYSIMLFSPELCPPIVVDSNGIADK